MKRIDQRGFALVELVISMAVLSMVVVSIFSLFTSLIKSTIISRNRSVATTLATNQMEYLKGLPYDSLAVAGGSIYSASPLPATSTQTVNNTTFTVKTSINYVDDAYDGCTNYPTLALKQLYCRNYPPPASAPSVDSNPEDYKIIHVSVKDSAGSILAEVDSQVAARVAETSSSTGALLVTVIDDNGNPVSGATVGIVNTTVTPNVNLSDSTDGNGVALFYGLPPDTGTDYVITASLAGYSTLSTIPPSGTLQATYPNQKIVVQQSSSITLTIKPMTAPSLLVEAVDTSGNPISNLKIYAKGGYKKYTATTDTKYYFDNLSPDIRPTTDSSGLTAISNLVPGNYYFCGDTGSTSCTAGSTTYYLAGALPYSSNSASFYPITVPRYDSANPPATTYPYNGTNYIQKVRLIFSTNSSFPRVNTLSPSTIAMSTTTLSNFAFLVTGSNLPCSSSAASCNTTVRFTQGANTYTAACTGASAGTQLSCTANLTGISTGFLKLTVTANGLTLNTPDAPPYGGISVSP